MYGDVRELGIGIAILIVIQVRYCARVRACSAVSSTAVFNGGLCPSPVWGRGSAGLTGITANYFDQALESACRCIAPNFEPNCFVVLRTDQFRARGCIGED